MQLLEKDIKEIVARLVKTFSPVKIYLFGSYASGKATADSDIDLLVVVDHDDEPAWLKTSRAYGILGSMVLPVEVLVENTSTFEKRCSWICSVEKEAVNHGKLIYESSGLDLKPEVLKQLSKSKAERSRADFSAYVSIDETIIVGRR